MLRCQSRGEAGEEGVGLGLLLWCSGTMLGDLAGMALGSGGARDSNNIGANEAFAVALNMVGDNEGTAGQMTVAEEAEWRDKAESAERDCNWPMAAAAGIGSNIDSLGSNKDLGMPSPILRALALAYDLKITNNKKSANFVILMKSSLQGGFFLI